MVLLELLSLSKEAATSTVSSTYPNKTCIPPQTLHDCVANLPPPSQKNLNKKINKNTLGLRHQEDDTQLIGVKQSVLV